MPELPLNMADSIRARAQRQWALALKKTMTYTTSMSQVGAIKVPPQLWNDLTFSEVRGLLRSSDSDGATWRDPDSDHGRRFSGTFADQCSSAKQPSSPIHQKQCLDTLRWNIP